MSLDEESMSEPTDLVQGTVDLLILKTLTPGPLYGWAIAQRIKQVSNDVMKLNQNAIHRGLHRLEEQGWLKSELGDFENNGRAKYHSLTKASRPMLKGLNYSVSRRQILLLIGAGLRFTLAQTTNSIPKMDLFPAFFQLWQEPDVVSPTSRAERSLQSVIQPNAELYDAFTGPISVERATRYIERVEPLLPAIRTLHRWVDSGFDTEIAHLQKLLPDLNWRGTLIFMPNLFGFDAGGGPLNGKDILIFGLDTIARNDGPEADLAVMTSHEVFHHYHASFHPDWKNQHRGVDAPLYQLVWREGLATYASQQLNPTARLSTIFNDPALAPSCESNVPALASRLLKNLDGTDKELMMEWMSDQVRSSDVPPRAGYYFGWAICNRTGQDPHASAASGFSGRAGADSIDPMVGATRVNGVCSPNRPINHSRLFHARQNVYNPERWLQNAIDCIRRSVVRGISDRGSDSVEKQNLLRNGEEYDPLIYIPYRQKPLWDMSLMARTRVPGSLGAAFRREVQAVDDNLPVCNLRTLEINNWPFKVFGSLFGIFAGIALLLSSIGLYAVIAHSVSQRTQEIGVRLALGASGTNILRPVFAQGVMQSGLGLAIGLAGAFGLTRVLKAVIEMYVIDHIERPSGN
jgi:hypothetical protein